MWNVGIESSLRSKNMYSYYGKYISCLQQKALGVASLPVWTGGSLYMQNEYYNTHFLWVNIVRSKSIWVLNVHLFCTCFTQDNKMKELFLWLRIFFTTLSQFKNILKEVVKVYSQDTSSWMQIKRVYNSSRMRSKIRPENKWNQWPKANCQGYTRVS